MHAFFANITVRDAEEIFNEIIKREIYCYTSRYVGMYYRWSELRYDKPNNTAYVVNNSSHDYSCVICSERDNEREDVFMLYDRMSYIVVPLILWHKDRLSQELAYKVNYYFYGNGKINVVYLSENDLVNMGKNDYESLSEQKRELVSKLMEEANCSQDNAIFWLRFYSWDYERTKKYIMATRSAKEASKELLDSMGDTLENVAKAGYDVSSKSMREAMELVSDMAKKFNLTFNSVLENLKANDWNYEKVKENLKKTLNKNDDGTPEKMVVFDAKITLSELVECLKSQDNKVKSEIIMELVKDGGEDLVKELVGRIS